VLPRTHRKGIETNICQLVQHHSGEWQQIHVLKHTGQANALTPCQLFGYYLAYTPIQNWSTKLKSGKNGRKSQRRKGVEDDILSRTAFFFSL